MQAEIVKLQNKFDSAVYRKRVLNHKLLDCVDSCTTMTKKKVKWKKIWKGMR